MKTIFSGIIILLVIALVLYPLGTVLHILTVPGSWVTENFWIQLGIGLLIAFGVGKYIPRILRSLWFLDFWDNKSHRIPLLARLIIAIIPKDIDKANLLEKPEVEWEAEGTGVRRVGILIGPIPGRTGFSRILEPPAGIPYGGTFRTISDDRLIYTGRLGEHLIAELVSLGLNHEKE